MPQDFLPFARPDIGEAEIEEVLDTLQSGWLTTGRKAEAFENQFADFIGAAHAVAVNSATAGLHLALEAVGVGPGDTVVTSIYTFTATAEVARYLGADLAFVDVDPATYNMHPEALASVLESLPHGSVKAIVPVHVAGQACEMDAILELARDHGCYVVEDASHALPTTYKGRTVGTIGDVTVYSFYVTKPICTGEGGMIVTDDAALAERMRVMRLHGIDRNVFERYVSSEAPWYYEVVAPGFKYNLTDIAASLGIHQLRRVREMHDRRRAIAAFYHRTLTALPLELPWVRRPEDAHAWHLYVVQLKPDDLPLTRNGFITAMNEHGVGTSVHYIPLHFHPYWRERYDLQARDFPVATQLFERVVSLPIYSRMSDADARKVADTVQAIVQENSA